jgi:peptidoglycan/xylan/chitin deacetylase (PgdA/CDA1 family)
VSSREAARNSLIRLLAPPAALAYRERPRVRVIALHDVPERARDAFAAKMRRLAHTHNVVSLADALDRTGLDEGRLNVALTFDDGFEEHATVVAPLLRELGLPATFFIPSGSLDLSQPEADRFAKSALRRSGSFRFLRREDVELIAAEPNFEIGGHTAHHVDVGRLGEEGVGSEIVDDKAALEQLTGRPVRFFAFPFGSPGNLSAQALRAIADAGYRAAFTIVPGFWSRSRNPYLLGRDCLSVEMDERLWDAFLRGGYDALSSLKYRRRLRSVTA